MDSKSPDFLAWTAIPNAFFERACRKLSGLESQVLGLIARFTYGDHTNGRPEWLELSLVKFAGMTGAHRNGIAIALDRLERSGAIDSERVGRGKRYRVAVHRWSALKDLPPESTGTEGVDEEASPDAEASAPDAESAAPQQPVIRMGKHSVPLSSISFCSSCAEKVIQAVSASVVPQPTADPTQEPPKQTVQANERRTISTVNVPIDAPAVAAPDTSGQIDELDAFLSKRFARKLGEPPPHRMLVKAVAELNAAGVPLQDLLARVDARRSVFNSYAFLGNLVRDVIKAHAAATRHEPPKLTQAQQEDRLRQQDLSATEAIRRHATTMMAKLQGLSNIEKAVEALEHVNSNAAEYWSNTPKMYQVLEAVEWLVVDALAAQRLSAAQRKDCDKQIEGAMKERRNRISRETYTEEVARLRAVLVLKLLGWPRFTDVQFGAAV